MPSNVLPPAMETAELIWRDGVPESTKFGDVYFSRDDGLAETRYVFIERNHLPERFHSLGAYGHFVIAETGFGTGLNFLATWSEWLKQRPSEGDHAILHFISVERYPLSKADLRKALESWPELAPMAQELILHYPPLINGTHRLVLAGGRVRLTLYLGDVLDAWDDLEFQADAWFLDGFAPSLNPDMWLETAIGKVRTHSKPGTTLATFTSVGRVRRALAAEGFAMAKVAGFGRKREMLIGKLPVTENAPPQAHSPQSVAIIGAGIAGATLARNLAERGVPVILVDEAPEPGSGASGNAQGALYAKLGVDYNDQTELAVTALAFSQRFYQRWESEFWHPTGLLQLASTEQEQDRQRRFLSRNHYPDDVLSQVTAGEASELAGIPIHREALCFPQSGWLQPAMACNTLIDHPAISAMFDFRVESIRRERGQWVLHGPNNQQITAATLIIAAGHRTASIAPRAQGTEIRLKPIRGQVTQLRSESTQLPQVVICGTKYLNPPYNGYAITGATFDLRDNTPFPTLESHRENLEQLAQLLPSVNISGPADASELQGRVAFRCTTHDYQPAAGACPAKDEDCANGAYLLTGFGSKGLTWAPLMAEYLADRICGHPPCLNRRLSRRVDAERLYRKPLTDR
ncbi:bifunctional tRNA (5-methylaminomethyl-2-thiouridine)(34)-methyltransferase MnmD/FAD-dependent 5-carboxymethylaminomethyl-2-thiouridine(34) oxidoreductase MnmC [Marinobacter daepoensis]|uniref:bifunctional tRNA (5-methylaminomethyl-2-thiouridine)(34)-methyltransferase MnmD/FAD-dependent 5-carboxymethylaminomethyl-2-thiouridine(34) oxidoreductase MnmC n=1 Tax=Marinobacter daepoensis TaxID=262077 RepID=UPI00041AA5FC|nr:bifunctional tRNA (5-methylaminomethyl-2-thiouridine)(34)-methyltransferase MnmD/FAD-dependent 5-carboxymethylaminomethyl-2-thiouridine(34) oxidoreductase MnmC [Marinobacter daepoensis]